MKFTTFSCIALGQFCIVQAMRMNAISHSSSNTSTNHFGRTTVSRSSNLFPEMQNAKVHRNKRCSQWLFDKTQLQEDAVVRCFMLGSRCLGLMWYNNNGGDGRLADSGWYQGCGGSVATVDNADWDTIEMITIYKSEAWQNRFNKWKSATMYYDTLCPPPMKWGQGIRMSSETAFVKCDSDISCKGIVWYNNEGGDGRFGQTWGWYQGCTQEGYEHHVANQAWNMIQKPAGSPLAIRVLGRWTPIQALVASSTKFTQTIGSSKKSSVTKSSSWAQEVSSSMTVGMEATVGGEAFGGSATASTSLTVSASVRREQSTSYGEEIGSETTHTVEQEFTPKPGQMYLWQWVLDIDTTGDEYVKTRTREFAVTANKDETPKCIPGYASDIPTYQKCISSAYKIPGV